MTIGLTLVAHFLLVGCHHTAAVSRHVESAAELEGPLTKTRIPEQTIHPETFTTASHALEAVLRREKNVEVIAFGEYHQTKGSAKVVSSLRRFSEDLLPLFAGKASDLIIETWVAAEGCGETEERVVSQVRETTGRTDSTETEIISMIKKAQSIAVLPHILEMSCEDYESVYTDGEVDYDRMLRVLTRLLLEKAIRLRDIRARRRAARPRTVLMYGGSIHNDLYPEVAVKPYSFGPRLEKMLVGHYLEVDLFVPEYIENDRHLARQEWFPSFLAHQSRDKVLLFERGPSSYIIVFKRGLGAR